MMKKIVLGVLIMGILFSLAGCTKINSIDDMKNHAKEKLEEKYGEEFEILKVFDVFENRSFNVWASPKSNPDIVFEAFFTMADNDYIMDCYIEAIVAKQCKDKITEKLDEIDCDYYVNVKFGYEERDIPLVDTGITVEEFIEISEERIKAPSYIIYFSRDILEKSNEEIYDILYDISSMYDCTLSFYVLTRGDLNRVKVDYEKYYDHVGAELSCYLDRNYAFFGEYGETKNGRFGFFTTDGVWNKTKEEFLEVMEAIRKNELFL